MASIEEILGLDKVGDWFNDIGRGISKIPGFFEDLGGDLWKGVEGLGGQIGGLGKDLWGGIGNLGDALGGVWDSVKGLPDQFGQSLAGLGSDLWGGLEGLGRNIGDLGTNIWGGIEGLGQNIGDLGSDIWGGIKDVGSQVGEWGQKAWSGIEGLGRQIGDLGSDIWGGIKSFGGDLLGWLKDIPGAIGDAARQGWKDLKGFGQDIGSNIAGLGKDLWSGIEGLGSSIGSGIDRLGQNIGSELSRGWDFVKDSASRGWDAVSEAASQGWDTVKTMGSQIGDAITAGISGLWSGLKDLLGDVGGGLSGFVKDLLGRGDKGDAAVDTSMGSGEEAWQEAAKEQRAARIARGEDPDAVDADMRDSRKFSLGGALAGGGLLGVNGLGLGFAGGDWLPGGKEDALFGGQAKWEAEKALSEAMGYQASKEARVARLQAEIDAKFGRGDSPEAEYARTQLDALSKAQGDAAEGLATRQVDDAYSSGLTQHRAAMVQRGTANSGQDVRGRTKLAGGLFKGRADAALAGQKATQDFKNTLDSARRQTLGTALFDPINTTDLLNKRNAVASAKSSAWTGMVGDAANNANAVGMGMGSLF